MPKSVYGLFSSPHKSSLILKTILPCQAGPVPLAPDLLETKSSHSPPRSAGQQAGERPMGGSQLPLVGMDGVGAQKPSGNETLDMLQVTGYIN